MNHRIPPRDFQLQHFEFSLPRNLIAQHPTRERSASRLLDGSGSLPVDRGFREFPALLEPGDLLVLNDTRVIKARLFGEKPTGGAAEALVERVLPNHEVLAQLRVSKAPRPGSLIRFAGAFDAEVLGRAGADDSMYQLRFPSDPLALLESHGHIPLPPYVTHADTELDSERYQTVFAQRPGAIAAPTASLHFDTQILRALHQRGVLIARVTLHVGAGTFQPVRCANLAEHHMHSEWYEVGADTVAAIQAARARGGRIIAAGTTSLRALESAALAADGGADGVVDRAADGTGGNTLGADRRAAILPGARETELFITPGFRFRVVDHLLTNFHLPRSTLLMLVCAFAGYEHAMALYHHAVEARYRFFSYGDAMWLRRA